jgi:succinate dehydrogenase / fumarate reductase cytochrome b subunit
MQEVAGPNASQFGRVLRRLLRSTLGLKYVMALTGHALIGFLVVHLVGNLLIFKSPEALNEYSNGLHKLGGLLWVLRGGLILAALLHIGSAWRLTLINRRARPISYAHQATVKATYAARTMRVSGVIVLAYLFYHLAHFTLGGVDPVGIHDVFNMVVRGFSDWRVSGLYIVAQLLTGWHLSHGFASLFQSLGLTNTTYRPLIRLVSPVLAWGMTIGFVSIPVAVLAHHIQLAV